MTRLSAKPNDPVNRILTRRKVLLSMTILLALCYCVGCSGLIATFLIIFKGVETPAKYKFFKGKKVAVVCVAQQMNDYQYDEVPREVSRRVSALLEENVKKIEMVPQDKVNKWLKKHDNTIDDYEKMGRDLEAEMLLVVDIESFETSSQASPGSYQGRANASFVVYDITNKGNAIATENLSELVYPPNGRIAASERSEAQFRKGFVEVFANHIGCKFYPFDDRQLYAMDAQAGLSN